jgi:hypothetical protein
VWRNTFNLFEVSVDELGSAVLLESQRLILGLAVMCVKSMQATKAITGFYDETDGRLGSSAIVHLKAIEQPFQQFTIPYVCTSFRSRRGDR